LLLFKHPPVEIEQIFFTPEHEEQIVNPFYTIHRVTHR